MIILYAIMSGVYLWYVCKAITYELLIDEIKNSVLPEELKNKFNTNKVLLLIFSFTIGVPVMMLYNQKTHELGVKIIIDEMKKQLEIMKIESGMIPTEIQNCMLTDERFTFYT